MPGPFDRNRPDGAQTRRVKALFTARFDLASTTIVTLAELRCREPGCAPIETVITVRPLDRSVWDRRIPKPIAEIVVADIEGLERQP
jgi:hypothetical protein